MGILFFGMMGLGIAAQPMQYEQSFLRGRTKVDVVAIYEQTVPEHPTKITGTLTLTDSHLVSGKWSPQVTRKVRLAYLQDGTAPDVMHFGGTIVDTPFADERLQEVRVTEFCPAKTIEFFTPAYRIERMGILHACGKLAKVVAAPKPAKQTR
jgi:hypothetical protein